MAPPPEQLIRDYLNRLSVAARGQLDHDDRRALVNRTHDFIQSRTSQNGPPEAVEVARLLTGLGDPAGLVRQERQRLAALRGEEPEEAVSRGRVGRVLRRDAGKARGSSWHWPAQEGRAGLRLTLLEGGAGAAASSTAATSAAGTSTAATSAAGTGPGGTDGPLAIMTTAGETADGAPAEARPRPARPRWPSLVPARRGDDSAGAEQFADSVASADMVDSAESAGAVQTPAPAEAPAPVETPAVPESGAPESPADAESPAGAESPTGAWNTASAAWFLRQALLRSRAVGVQAAGWGRRNRLAAVTVVLLGLGVLFPPVWLIGAAFGLASRVWDGKDKWLGFGLPVLLTVIAWTLGIMHGGSGLVATAHAVRHSSGRGLGYDVHEGWVFGVLTSRVTAMLSACYLAWRAVHGRRPPVVPPWQKPRTIR